MGQHIRGNEGIDANIEDERDKRIELVLVQGRQNAVDNGLFNGQQIMMAQEQFGICSVNRQAPASRLGMPITDDPNPRWQLGRARTETLKALDELETLSRRSHWPGHSDGSRIDTIGLLLSRHPANGAPVRLRGEITDHKHP